MATKKTNTAKKTSGKKTTKPRTIKVVEETDDGRTVDATSATDAKSKKSKAEPQDKKLSALDAAAKVLAESSEPLNTKQMVEAMAAKGYWTSPGGKTPHDLVDILLAIADEIDPPYAPQSRDERPRKRPRRDR